MLESMKRDRPWHYSYYYFFLNEDTINSICNINIYFIVLKINLKSYIKLRNQYSCQHHNHFLF
jgi:hypothetical protein